MRKPNTSKMVFITNPTLASMFSGCDVWLIPLVEELVTIYGKGVVAKYNLDFDNMFLGDDWYIQNQQIYGYNKGPFAIGIPLNRFNAKFCEIE